MARTDHGEALTQLILEVFRANGALLDVGNKLTAPHGLTSARWQVMGAIDLEDQPLTVSQIARRMGLARQGVQRIINDLNELGFVAASDNVDHKRAPLFSLSASGVEVIEEINAAQAAWVNQLAAGLDQQGIEQAQAMLRTLRTRADDTPTK